MRFGSSTKTDHLRDEAKHMSRRHFGRLFARKRRPLDAEFRASRSISVEGDFIKDVGSPPRSWRGPARFFPFSTIGI